MSRESYQELFLRAMLALDKEHGPLSDGAGWRVWAIIKMAFKISPELQQREVNHERRFAEIDAKLGLSEEALKGLREALKLPHNPITGQPYGRPRTRDRIPAWIEHEINPSRVLRTLERHRFVTRIHEMPA
jgi:hypothetical protein